MDVVRRGLLVAAAVLALLLGVAGAAMAGPPTRVLMITMDGMKPGYVQLYDMDNMRWLQRHGVNFTRAYVGQMATETVVSHNTMVSGLFPKNMGWSDEVLRDVDNVLGYGAGAMVTTGDLSYQEYTKLIEALGYPKIGDYLHAAFPGRVVANVGQKKYQVESTAASSSDYWVYMGSRKRTADLPDPSVLPWSGRYRGPAGNVPPYILNDHRFKISSGNPGDAYGTNVDKPAWLYPEDGRYHPGVYPGHESGDAWVADAAMKIMEREDWSFIHLNFSGIDKIAHLWGGGPVDSLETYGWDPASPVDMVHMPWIAKNADRQLGRLMAKLKALGQWDETLVVVLGDHGFTHGERFYGIDKANGAYESWYNGVAANVADYAPSSNPWLRELNDTGNIAFSYQSTAIEVWLVDQSMPRKMEAARIVAGMPGVIATYIRMGDRYVLTSTGAMTVRERAWWAAHAQEIVDTMAFDGAAEVVGLFGDRVCYAAYGDHGGAQREVQRIPMVMFTPGVQPVAVGTPARLVDVMPTVLRAMGVRATAPMDGKAFKLPRR